jgi:DsbE subfamily thiol:disulfide oxidoreductase
MNTKVLTLIILVLVCAGGVFLLSSTDDRPAPHKAVTGGRAPDFTLQDTEGRTWRLADLAGKIVLVNFWASWCDPCRDEMPSIQSLLNSQKGNDTFVFLSILYRDDPGRATAYLREKGFAFPVLIDSKNVALSYGVTGVPETFIIDKTGVIKDKIIGPLNWDAPEVRAALTKLMSDRRS